MPRRIYTYAPGRGWEAFNLIESIGASGSGYCGISIRNQRLSLTDIRRSGRQRSLGRVDAGMVHHFAAAGIQLRRSAGSPKPPALWDLKHPEDPDWKYE